ncbi:MAG: DUF1214 domain-containing protein [Alphaproteobacteria bacterium]|nr:MAG: DUF1214 domain-containing protein [Alphaproteobacteria bacterium]
MRALGTFFLVLSAALVLGVGSALYVLESQPMKPDIQVGPWQGSSEAGSVEAGIYTRAAIARSAMLALTRQEAIYFIASTDSSGDMLTSSCRYNVSVEDQPARWWSITAYGPDYYLIPNDGDRYSFTKTDMVADDEPVQIFALAMDDAGMVPVVTNGVMGGQAFSLLLRLYHPHLSVLMSPDQINAPQIIKLGCG